MTIQVYREKAKHSSQVSIFFDFNQLDAFHNQEVLSVIYGENWESILITDEDKAFLHTFSKQKIDDTDWYDIEPFLGYSGPVVNKYDNAFIDSALKIYSELCKAENIIAEIIRFNPLLQNHKFFENSKIINVFSAKEIVITDCFEDKERQIQDFSGSSRRNARLASKNYQCIIQSSSKQIKPFLEIYYSSLSSINAGMEWYFSEEFFKRAESSSLFKMASVVDDSNLYSASLIIECGIASYYFLTGNSKPHVKGVNELLILEICVDAAKNGTEKMFLGGGNSASSEDSLLLYKKRFSKEAAIFHMGKLVHNDNAFKELCEEAIARNHQIADINFFLKYRL